MSNKLLCVSIDSEHYTDLCKDAVVSVEEAVKVLKERELEAGHEILSVTTSTDGEVTRITLSDNNPDDEYFVVAEVMPMPTKRYAVVWWHAYNGVGFDLKGASDDSKEAAKMLSFYVRNHVEDKYIPDDYKDGDTSVTCDTGKEWEMLEIVNLKEVA